MKRKMEISELIFKIIAYVILIIFAIACVYPFLYALGASFSSDAALTQGIVLWPMIGESDNLHFGFSINAYGWAFTNTEFWVAYSNTLFMTFFGTIWSLFYSILGAYALSKKRIMGRRGWNFFLVFTMWFTAGVVATYSNYVTTGEVFASIAKKIGAMSNGETDYEKVSLRLYNDVVSGKIKGVTFDQWKPNY